MGELAALGTAVCWTFSSIFNSLASNAFGSMKVNRIRLIIAVIYLMITHLILRGHLLPVDAGWDRWAWLGLSGIAGLVLGDGFLLQSYVLVGTRIGTLMMAIYPVISTLLAWIFLGEKLSFIEILGILVTVSGISLVVLERNRTNMVVADRKKYLKGVFFGFLGALGMAVGLILSKIGLHNGYPTISGVSIRMFVSMSSMWVLAAFSGDVSNTFQAAIKNRRVLGFIAAGATVGPFAGVWLSLIAVQSSYVGVASTLMSLMPILVLPILKFFFKEHISLQAVIGTVIALAGVAILFVQG